MLFRAKFGPRKKKSHHQTCCLCLFRLEISQNQDCDLQSQKAHCCFISTEHDPLLVGVVSFTNLPRKQRVQLPWMRLDCKQKRRTVQWPQEQVSQSIWTPSPHISHPRSWFQAEGCVRQVWRPWCKSQYSRHPPPTWEPEWSGRPCWGQTWRRRNREWG